MNYLLTVIENRMQSWGSEPLCNGHSERAPHIGSFCFPLCWRCTAITSGTAVLYWVNFNSLWESPTMGFICAILCCIPCLIDVYAQYYLNYESTNKRRIITGFMTGMGLVILSELLLGY